LAKIKDNLYTQTWKKIAKKRHDFMVKFFKQLDEEIYWS
jgi:HD superfamily phosphodiesterase